MDLSARYDKSDFYRGIYGVHFALCTKTDMKKYRAVSSFICFSLLAIVLTACVSHDSRYEEAYAWKLRLFQRLQGNLSKPVAERVQKMPAELLKATQDHEKSIGITSAVRYAARTPTADDMVLFKSYLDLLPPAHQAVFAKKLLAVYLIDGFSGAGLANWVVDQKGQTYYYIILNSSLFRVSLDDWLSYKNDSQFDKSEQASPTIRVRTQTDFKALIYGLLHEGAHIVDIESGATPYFDHHHRRLIGITQKTSEFTDRVWTNWLQPAPQSDFAHRIELNPYGSFPRKGSIPRAELSEMFSQLMKTPFVSFYSGASWNEDLADYVSFYHIEKKLGGSITMELLDSGNVIDLYAPIKSPWLNREKYIQAFYD